jgi:hypothetical protein
MKGVADQYADVLGNDMGSIDPLTLTDSTVGSLRAFTPEPPSVFLNRTLMTGSDIAELNSTLIANFAALTLDINQTLSI